MRLIKYLNYNDGRQIKFMYGNEYVTPNNYIDQLHSHNYCELCIFITGDMFHIAEGRSYYLRYGDVFFCREHELHFGKPVNPGLYERFAIWFPRDTFDFLSIGSAQTIDFIDNEKFKGKNVISLDVETRERVLALLHKIKNIIQNSNQSSEMIAFSHIIEVLVLINISAGKTTDIPCLKSKFPKQIYELLDYIGLNAKNISNLSDISDVLHLNKEYMSRIFKKNLKISIIEYIKIAKVTQGKKMLINGSNTTEAGFACGFSSTSYFIQVFKKIVGVTPSQYKENMRRNLPDVGLSDIVIK